MTSSIKLISKMNNSEARDFLMKNSSYCSITLPPYIFFDDLISSISKELNEKELSNYYENYKKPQYYDDVNYKLFSNKNGKYDWRPLQLIHPVLYVSLVNLVTEPRAWSQIVKRLNIFSQNPKIKSYGLPSESKEKDCSDVGGSINNWWRKVEQKSIENSLDYEYLFHTDITNCYGTIYTHSVPWALHEKDYAKKNRTDKSLIGNLIDQSLQSMSYGQTNGIPQGSVLMDFIAEIVLGYADLLLLNKIKKINDYEIIRYRDDYRIFTNNPREADEILKCLTEVLIDLGMRLNPLKTISSSNVITSSIKKDKLYWLTSKNYYKNLQKQLLLIHDFSEKFPNSGTLDKSLQSFYSRVKDSSKIPNNEVLISIVVEIAYKNPKSIPVCSAILSKLISLSDHKEKLIDKVISRFNKIPNTGYLKLWLQRLTISEHRKREYNEVLCMHIVDSDTKIWNSEWLNSNMNNIIESSKIVNEEKIKNLKNVIQPEEFEVFKSYY